MLCKVVVKVKEGRRQLIFMIMTKSEKLKRTYFIIMFYDYIGKS